MIDKTEEPSGPLTVLMAAEAEADDALQKVKTRKAHWVEACDEYFDACNYLQQARNIREAARQALKAQEKTDN
jgi:hypothetical protein